MQTLSRRLASLAFLLALTGCAGRPHDVLVPVLKEAAGTGRVDVLVATTRAADKSPGVMFNGSRSEMMAYADVDVSIPPDTIREIGEVQWPKALPGNPATDS